MKKKNHSVVYCLVEESNKQRFILPLETTVSSSSKHLSQNNVAFSLVFPLIIGEGASHVNCKR